jgi:hypothetical protein
MKLNFKINDKYLLIHALNTRQPAPFKEWEDLRNNMFKKYPDASWLFLYGNHLELMFLDTDDIENYLDNIKNQTKKLLSEGLKSKAFKKLKKETEEYLGFVKNQWETNYEIILKELPKITGLEMPKKEITVHITHPKMFNGISRPSFNSICWGHKENWKNYTTVYLCHELLHLITRGKEKDVDVMHAIIELACDNELRIRLNGKGKYFEENEKNIGHPFLKDLVKKILPEWKRFLKRGKDNIFDFEQEILKNKKVHPTYR